MARRCNGGRGQREMLRFAQHDDLRPAATTTVVGPGRRRVSKWRCCSATIPANGNPSMFCRIVSLTRHIFVWSCAVLAIGMAGLCVRSFWHGDEAGYYTYKPAPGLFLGRDCRNLIGSWQGGIFWLCTEADVQWLDWYGGDPTEIILNSAPGPQLLSAALATGGGTDFRPRWSRGGFNLKADSGQSPSGQWSAGNRWWYRGVVVPHWALFLALAWAPALRLRHLWILRQRRLQGLCLNCGYDVRASGEVCSECGGSLRKLEPAAPLLRSGRNWRWVAAGLLVAGAVTIWLCLHGRGERPEAVVRLGRATTLPAGELPKMIELEVGGGVNMRFALIPSGRFLMGSPPSEAGRYEDETQHEVILSKPFYMATTGVTQEQYQAVMGNNPSSFKDVKNPVETVSWDNAVAFCRRLSERSGRKVRLPTEAEREYACRAGTSTPFYTGRTLRRDMANYPTGYTFPSNRKGKSVGSTLPVGSFRPNAWGLYDMNGNVLEWCADRYGEYASGTVDDPTGAASGTARVVRGGSWFSFPRLCRSAYRYRFAPDSWNSNLGFRLALDFP